MSFPAFVQRVFCPALLLGVFAPLSLAPSPAPAPAAAQPNPLTPPEAKAARARNNAIATDEEIIEGDIGYPNREGGPVDYLDWPTFLMFADKYFSVAQASRP